MENNNLFNSFIGNCVEQFNWTEEKIRKLLKDRFGAYIPQKEPMYLNFLCEVAEEEDEQNTLKILREQQYGPDECPICGSGTVPALAWYSPSNTKPWKCLKGGVAHFFMTRINKIREHQGLNPVFEREIKDGSVANS